MARHDTPKRKQREPSPLGFTLFETGIGACGIVWGEQGVVCLLLPELRARLTRSRLQEMYPDAVEGEAPREVRRAMQQITRLCAGDAVDLSGIRLDLSRVSDFYRRVYEASRAVPAGETITYGELAARLGVPGGARAVGQALGKNPCAIVVPCHRVLAAGGKLGGFSAHGGVLTKRRLLEIEKAPALAVPAANKPTKKTAATDAAPLFAQRPRTEAVSQGANSKKLTAQMPAGATKVACEALDITTAQAHLSEIDPILGRFMHGFGPYQLQLKQVGSVFEALAEAIVYQQLTGKAAATIWGRVCALFPKQSPTARRLKQTSMAALRAAGLSNAKALSLLDLAQRTERGELPTLTAMDTMSDAQIVASLTAVRGIGKWTAEMLLIFRLGRADVLPIDDYGVRKGFHALFETAEVPTPKTLEAYGKRWAPYRTVASWYLWRAAEQVPRLLKTKKS